MRIVLSMIIIIVVTGCSRHTEEKEQEHNSALVLPDIFTYKGRNPQWGNNEDLRLIMRWDQMRSELDYNFYPLIADTLTLHFADGHQLVFDKNSAVSHFKIEFDGVLTQKITINAAIPVFYPDVEHHWVYSWIFQEKVLANGDSLTAYFHEDFRIENGKIREIFQFKREAGIKMN